MKRCQKIEGVYAYCYAVIKRLEGAGHVIAPNTIRIPNNGGLVFNCTWDKILTMGSHCFGIYVSKTKKRGVLIALLLIGWTKLRHL